MPRGCFGAHRVAGVVSSASDDTALAMSRGLGAKDKVFFSLGPLLGAGASSCVHAVMAETFATDDVRSSSSLQGTAGFAAKFFRRDNNPQLTALEREIKILATLPPSPYIVGFHGQYLVKKDDPALQEVAKNLLPKGRDRRDLKDSEDFSVEMRAETISVILVDRCDCTLTSMIQKTAFHESHSAFAMGGLLRGIAHLHAQRVVHRDIKDANILIADSGRRVCLCDFDLATYIPEDAEVIEWKGGTPGYMAPEVCNYGKASFSADLFSAGVVLHVLLTRTNPFLPEHAGLKVQGSSPMDYDMLRLFRSEASCNLLYALLEMDPEMRPKVTESLEHSWFFELVPQSLCELLADPDRLLQSCEGSQRTGASKAKYRIFMPRSKAEGASALKSPPPSGSRTTVSVSSMLSRVGAAARNLLDRPSRRTSRVIPIQEFDEICLP